MVWMRPLLGCVAAPGMRPRLFDMASTDKKTVPVAYVTKWATTEGITIFRDAEVTASGALSLRYIWVPPAHWTEDRATAEGRWRKAMSKAADAAEKKAKRLRAAAALPPKYTER